MAAPAAPPAPPAPSPPPRNQGGGECGERGSWGLAGRMLLCPHAASLVVHGIDSSGTTRSPPLPGCAAGHRRHAEVAERQQLLERRGALGEPARAYDDGAVRQSAESSKRMLEEAYQTGAAILGGMATQRDTLKSAHRKALDVLNSTGLSASLLRVIERRQSMDKILAYGGMALTLVLVILLYWWFKA